MTFIITTLSIKAFSIMTFSVTTLSIMTYRIANTQHDDIQNSEHSAKGH